MDEKLNNKNIKLNVRFKRNAKVILAFKDILFTFFYYILFFPLINSPAIYSQATTEQKKLYISKINFSS